MPERGGIVATGDSHARHVHMIPVIPGRGGMVLPSASGHPQGGIAINRRLMALLVAVPLAVTVFPTSLLAHVRWFAKGRFMDAAFLLDTTTILIALGAVLYVVLAVFVEHSRRVEKLGARLAGIGEAWAEAWRGIDWRLIALLTGVMLIANAVMGVYLAPNIELPSESLAPVGAVAQVLVGLLLLLQVSYTIGGALVLVVAVITLVLVSPVIMIDYVFEFVALALALIFVGPAYCRLDRRIYERLGVEPSQVGHLAVPIIRVGVGLTLIILAIHNKLLNPGITMAFLEEYHFNFMPALGFEGFSDLHFTFAAGVGELTLGLLIALGIATRVVVLNLTGFFIATLIMLGPLELLGHAPLFGIAIMLIVRGSGGWAVHGFPVFSRTTGSTSSTRGAWAKALRSGTSRAPTRSS